MPEGKVIAMADEKRCADCGAVLGDDEGRLFTVCEDCWDDHYHNGNCRNEGER